jgi:hypothetical protein
MAKNAQPFTLIRRTDSKSYRLTLNPSCGLSARACKEWYRRSFQHLSAELANYRNPKLSKNDSEGVSSQAPDNRPAPAPSGELPAPGIWKNAKQKKRYLNLRHHNAIAILLENKDNVPNCGTEGFLMDLRRMKRMLK